MAKKNMHAPASTYEVRGFFLRPFVKYLRPHYWRIAIALFSMIAVGFFGSFSILMLKTPLEILFGAGRQKQAAVQLEQAVKDAAEPLNRLLTQEAPAGTPQKDAQLAFEAVKQALAEKEAADAQDDIQSQAPKRMLQSLPGAKQIEAWVNQNFSPLKERFKVRKAQFEDWVRRDKREALWLFAFILVLFTTLKGAAEYIAKYHLAHTLYHAMVSLKEDIFRHIIGLDYGFFIKRTTGFLESRVNSDVGRVRVIFDAIISDGVQQPIMLFFHLVVLFVISPRLTWIALLGMLVAFIPLYYFARQIKKVTRKSKHKEDELNSTMEESLRNYRVVKIFGGEHFEVGKFHDLNQKMFKLFIQRRIARFASSPIMEIIGSVAAAAVLVIGGMLVVGQPDKDPILEPSAFVVYLIVCTRFYGPLKKLSRMNVNWTEARVSASRILEMLHVEPEVQERPDARPIQRLEHAIELRNVTFSYGDAVVLKDINFSIPRGKIVALVGRSGSGKSTIANLLPRLFDPTGGAIFFDGQDARDLKLADLRHLFGVVTQDTILFNDTVEANIAYAQDNVDRERVKRCAQAAFAHDFVLQLDGGRGYKTVVGQGGQSLSGGQRQRLAIARALYRDPDVLILDEATSSLDTESERYVQEAIDNLLRGRTALIIAHRLSTIQHADEILVLEGGTIVERGSHEQLLEADGEYRKLYHMAVERKSFEETTLEV